MTEHFHIEHLIDDFVTDRLSAHDQQSVLDHVAECSSCNDALVEARDLAEKVALLPREINPPVPLWKAIESEIQRDHESSESALSWSTTLLLAAACVSAAALFLYVLNGPKQSSWPVTAIHGTPVVDSKPFIDGVSLGTGQTLLTDEKSRATITVGSIGTVDVLPDSRVEILATKSSDHRLRLSAGTIHASITAPPRLFFVETPSATAIDLGCEYTLSVDGEGRSFLDVSFGYVELEHARRSTVVPAGYAAIADATTGPTVAFDNRASQEFIDAIAALELESDPNAVHDIIRLSSNEDATTVWLLMRRYPEIATGLYDRLTEMVGTPADISREGTLGGNKEMIRAWESFLDLDLMLMTFEI